MAHRVSAPCAGSRSLITSAATSSTTCSLSPLLQDHVGGSAATGNVRRARVAEGSQIEAAQQRLALSKHDR